MQLLPIRMGSRRSQQQRKAQRIPTFGVVEIQNENGSVLERVTLRDLSSRGALIQLASSQQLPDTITLWFPTDRIQKSASIRWRKNRSIGVEFDEPIVLPDRLEHRKDRAAVIASYFKAARK